MADPAAPRRLGYANATWAFLLAGVVALLAADLGISTLDPWAELARVLAGVLRPDFAAVNLSSVVLTVAFAVIGVGGGAAVGFALALPFARSRSVRVFCAAIRSIHELFWALLLMQIAGPSPVAGLLAIGVPYAGIFAKVFAELIEEADLAAARVLPSGTSGIARLCYVVLPELAAPFGNYLLYRLECGLRSTLVLGFIGLPTMGFELESYFREGHYAEAAGFVAVFYLLIGTRRLWARPATLPFLVAGSIAALALLTAPVTGESVWTALGRFLSHDIVPHPLRHADLLAPATWQAFAAWLWPILRGQVVPGVVDTLVVSQLALLAAALLALAVFPFTCRRFAGVLGRPMARALLVIVRATPEYMLAYVLLQLLGPSMLPAVIALALHNGGIVGYLMGRHADALAYRADAPRGPDLYFYETLPRLYGQFLAYCLYRWEIIVRESAIFGILGVRTLGFHVDAAISELRLDVAVVLLIATGGLSMAIDALSRALRRRLRVQDQPVRLSATDTHAARAAPATPEPACI
jgi:phosphonate transport system permease protein